MSDLNLVAGYHSLGTEDKPIERKAQRAFNQGAYPPFIDTHVHVIVPELLRGEAGEEDWRPSVSREEGRMVVYFGGRTVRSMVHEAVDIAALLEAQARRGVNGVLVCPWVSLLYPDANPQACLERCRIQNRALANIVLEQPERVMALGAVPLQDPDLAAAELRALRSEGVLLGVEVPASVRGVYLGEDRFEVFWAAAAETDSLVFIHPTTRGFVDPAFEDHYLWNTVGNPFETTLSAAGMVMAGVMERHPRLRVLLAHGGGALLALRGRLDHAHRFQEEARSRLGEPPSESIRRFYFDTVTHDPDQLAALVGWAGPDRVLLGSDYPFDMGDPDPVAAVRALGLEPAAERRILGGNLTKMLGGEKVE